MAGSVNKVILIGNLGADPEIRNTQDGRSVANLSMATNETWRDRNTGERRERTEWHRVSIFNENLVRIVENHLHKGSKVYVEGQIRTRKWQDRSGQQRFSTEIVLQGFNSQLQILDTRSDGGDLPRQQGGDNYSRGNTDSDDRGADGGGRGNQDQDSLDDEDDDVPF